MANLKAALTLTGTQTDLGGTLTLSVSNTLGITSPMIGISKMTAPVTSGVAVEIKPTGSANQYTYIKHTGYQTDGTTVTTNQLSVQFDATDTIRIEPGEFAFFPCKSNVVVKVISSDTEDIQVEYAYWTAS